MKIESNHRRAASLRVLSLLAAIGLALPPVVQAEPAKAGMKRVVAALKAPPRQAQGQGDLLVMVCRRGLEDMQPMQEMQQDLPLLCMATETDEQSLQMGPARFRELLETAAKSGSMMLFVLPQ